MRLLLDTTYFLPAIGVAVRGIPRSAPKDVQNKGHALAMSTISLFELTATGAKFSARGKLDPHEVTEGVTAILHDPDITLIQFYESDVIQRAVAIRREIQDFIDCLILATASARVEALVTEDEELSKLVEMDHVTAKLSPRHSNFTVFSIRRVP